MFPFMSNNWDRELRFAMAITVLRIRNGLGLNQEQVAVRSGLSRQYISMLERGKRVPNLRTIYQLSEGLGISQLDFCIDLQLNLNVEQRKIPAHYRAPLFPISLVAERIQAVHKYKDDGAANRPDLL